MKKDPSSAVQSENRRLAAIMFTDIVGFSRQMGSNEARTLQLLETHNQLIQQAVAEHHGTVIKTVGDAFLVDFPSVVNAVQCAQQIQAQLRAHTADKEPTEQIHVRIGLHLGDIVQKDGDVFGDGVNIAARLQGLAAPDTICLSQAVYKEIEKKLPLDTVIALGKPKLKNIAQRERVYALLPETPTGFRQRLRVQRLKLTQWRRTLQVVMVLLVLVWAGVVTLRSFFPIPPLGRPQQATPTEPRPALPLPDKPSIVVLPFDNMSGDPQQDYFSNGITEVLTNDLFRISSLFVIARNTAFTYRGKAINIQDIGRELGVHYVLEGSVQKTSDQVRIVVQLIDTTTGGHLWSQRYDRPLKDIFALQDDIVQKIVTTLRLQFTVQEQGLHVRKRTDNLEAYDFYLRGLEYFLRFTKEGNTQARQMCEKALELDSQYADAYAGLGWTYFFAYYHQWSQEPQGLERALTLARQAIDLDDSLPTAHTLLGTVYLHTKQYEQAIVEAERAVTLAPNSTGYVWLGIILNFTGQAEKAIGVLEQALRLDPHYPVIFQMPLGWAYLLTGRYEEAIATQKKILSRNRNILDAHLVLTISYSELGREEEARAEAAEVLRLSPNYSVEVIRQTWPYKDPTYMERTLAGLRKAGLK